MYETYTLTVAADLTKDNPCADVEDADSSDPERYGSASSATSLNVMTTEPETIQGLCVRVVGSSEASFAWGISPPEEPNVGTQDVDKNVTKELEWSDVDLKAGFDYEINLAADPERPTADNKIGASSAAPERTTPATSRAVQSACDAGREVDSFTPDIDLADRTVSVGNLAPHTGYLLCLRASNGAGTSAWAVSIQGDDDNGYGNDTDNDSNVQETYTRPAAPPRITSAGSESTPADGNDNEKLAPAWEIGTRNVNNVPREEEDFNVTVYFQNAAGAAALRVAACGSAQDDLEGYALIANGDLKKTDGLAGFEVEVTAAGAIERWGYTRKVYLCAQADSNGDAADADKGVGPWTISSVFDVAKPSTSLSSSVADEARPGEATLTIKGWNKAWFYSSSPDRDDDPAKLRCDPVGAATDETTFDGEAKTRYSVTAWDNDTCDGRELGTRSLTTKE